MLSTRFLFLIFICLASLTLHAQFSNPRNAYPNQRARPGGDSSLGFKHRDDLKDSITISYRYLDSLKSNRLDSSLNDFNTYFSTPANYITLGNNGSPSYPVLFSPVLKTGFDPGFHQFDVYKFTLENTRYFKTTKPYSQLTYLLASGKEQFVNVVHTQNIKPQWNFGFEYKLIAAPGFFKSQNSNDNSYRFFTNYQGKKKRYAVYFTLLGNKFKTAENGGIRNVKQLDSSQYTNRFGIATNLGGDVQDNRNVFSTNVNTGNIYSDFTFFLRQSYDVGKKDSIRINDSTQEYLFYPKLRFQHTLTYKTYSFIFLDTLSNSLGSSNYTYDSMILKKWYDTSVTVNNGINFRVKEQFRVMSNDFSLRQFPQTTNTAQFLEVGLRLETIAHLLDSSRKNYYNVVGHAEYRNKTKNKKWDALATGELYLNGLDAGDFSVYASLQRYLNARLGDIQLLFQNLNRTPSFIFNGASAFNFTKSSRDKKENIVLLAATTENPRFNLTVRNISIANYAYFTDYYHTDQYASLVNLSQAQLSKKTSVSKHVNLYSDFIVQQTTGSSPIRVPFFYTRQRLVLEGNYFKNLNISTGLDVNYSSPYKPFNYSPVMGQFFPQDSTKLYSRPNVSAFMVFRIKSFRGLVKLENLNTIDFANGFGFTKNNFAAPGYPLNGMVFRIGVQWVFVN